MSATHETSYYFSLFSGTHLMFLAVTIPIAIALAVFLAKKIGFSKKLVWVCLILGLLCELEKIFFFMTELEGGGYRLPAEHIPFNLCPSQIFFIFALAVSRDVKNCKILLAYMYPTMLAGGFFGMLLPSVIDQGYHGLLDLATYRYFFFHAMVIFLGFYLYLSKPIEYTIKSYVASFVSLLTIAFVIIWLNAFFGWDSTANFWYLVRPPAENLPIINIDNGWPIYVRNLMFLALILITLCYLRVIIRDLPGVIRSIKDKMIKKQSV